MDLARFAMVVAAVDPRLRSLDHCHPLHSCSRSVPCSLDPPGVSAMMRAWSVLSLPGNVVMSLQVLGMTCQMTLIPSS